MSKKAAALTISALTLAALGAPAAASAVTQSPLDASFGQRGILPVPLVSAEEDRLHAITPAADGGYFASGYAVALTADPHFAVAKITADGKLDPTFGTGGKATFNVLVGAGSENAQGVGVQSDGKVVLAGGVANDVWVVRFNANGTPDTSFGTLGTGAVQIDLSPGTGTAPKQDAAWGLAIQADDKIVIEAIRGTRASENREDADLAAIRLTKDGGRDTTFGNGTDETGTGGDDLRGVQLLDIKADPATFLLTGTNNNAASGTRLSESARQLSIAPDSKILLGSYSAIPGVTNSPVIPLVARLNTNGTPDTSFGTGGAATVQPFGVPAASANAAQNGVAEVYIPRAQSDGKVIVTGYGRAHDVQTFQDQWVGRLNVNGTLDTTFGVNGKAQFAPGGTEDRGRSLVIQPDDAIVVAGSAVTAGDHAPILVRYTKNGQVDTSFGNAGVVDAGIGGRASAFFGAALSKDGTTVAAAGWDGRALAGTGATQQDNGLIARVTVKPVEPTVVQVEKVVEKIVEVDKTPVLAAPVALAGIKSGRTFTKKKRPRVFGASVSSPDNVSTVAVRLTRGTGSKAKTYSASKEKFTGSRTASPFSVVYSDGAWSLRLPKRLTAGKYKLEVFAYGRDKKAQPAVNGTNVVSFSVK